MRDYLALACRRLIARLYLRRILTPNEKGAFLPQNCAKHSSRRGIMCDFAAYYEVCEDSVFYVLNFNV